MQVYIISSIFYALLITLYLSKPIDLLYLPPFKFFLKNNFSFSFI